VLVVDDSDIDRQVITLMLKAALPNAMIFGASSGFEALLAVGRQPFDALITDIAMPNMNGFEMLRYLSQAGPQRPRHLLATSSSSLLQLRRLGTLPPGVTFMRKPLGASGLSAWLASRFPASRPASRAPSTK
jgi:CheY-like chemotaxis protein